MQIIEQLRSEIAKKRLSVLKVANETGISAYKMYKWLDGKAQPKHDDVVILEKWLRKKVENVLSEEIGKIKDPPKPTQTAVVIGIEDLRALQEKISELLDVSLQNQKLLQQLNDEDDNEVDVPGLSNKKRDTKNYSPDKSGGAGNKRT